MKIDRTEPAPLAGANLRRRVRRQRRAIREYRALLADMIGNRVANTHPCLARLSDLPSLILLWGHHESYEAVVDEPQCSRTRRQHLRRIGDDLMRRSAALPKSQAASEGIPSPSSYRALARLLVKLTYGRAS